MTRSMTIDDTTLRSRLPAALLAALVLLALPARAQDPSAGPLTGTPATILVGPATVSSSGVLAEDSLHRKPAGFVPFQPEGPAPAPTEPQFTAVDMFGGGLAPPDFAVNAFSIGEDVVLAEVPSAGKSAIAIPPGAWGALLFSVTRTTVGEPGSLIESEVAKADGAGADLFTYILPGSQLPASVASCYPDDVPQRAIDATEMDLFDGATAGEISAVDFYSPLYEVGQPVRSQLSAAPTVYFSIAHDDVFPPGGGGSVVPAAWFGASTPSSATILRTTWRPAIQAWTPPRVFLPYTALGLGLVDDIDALAVDETRELLLFSIVETAASTQGEQLQVASWAGLDSAQGAGGGGGVEVGIYVVDRGGDEVAGRLGIASGDIDSTCTLDPGEQFTLLDLALGNPVNALSPLKSLSIGVFRDAANGGPTITVTVSGVPTTPAMPLQRLELWLAFETAMGGYNFFAVPSYAELLDGSQPDEHREVSFTVPALGALIGVPLDFLWVVRPAPGVFPSSALVQLTL